MGFTAAWLIVELSNIYTWIIVIYVLFSWFPRLPGILADIERALGVICEPYLGLFRRFIPPVGGAIDFSPWIAVIVLQLVVRVIVGLVI